MDKIISAIDTRYSVLAGQSCCLSCGGAVEKGLPKEGETVVDLGCGRGAEILKAADIVGYRGQAYGIDLSEVMLSKARTTADRLGIENVKFLHAELEQLPLEDSCADLVMSNCVLNHARDKQKVWNEIARILKPGGRIAVSDIFSMVNVPDEFAESAEAVSECWAGAVTKEVYISQVILAGLSGLVIAEESEPYQKGAIDVCSFTLLARKA